MPKLKPSSRSTSSGPRSIQEFLNTKAQATEKSSDEFDQATCVEAMGIHIVTDDIPGTSIHVALISTPSSDKCHKPGPVGISKLKESGYPDIYGSSLVKENRNEASDSDKLRILKGFWNGRHSYPFKSR